VPQRQRHSHGHPFARLFPASSFARTCATVSFSCHRRHLTHLRSPVLASHRKPSAASPASPHRRISTSAIFAVTCIPVCAKSRLRIRRRDARQGGLDRLRLVESHHETAFLPSLHSRGRSGSHRCRCRLSDSDSRRFSHSRRCPNSYRHHPPSAHCSRAFMRCQFLWRRRAPSVGEFVLEACVGSIDGSQFVRQRASASPLPGRFSRRSPCRGCSSKPVRTYPRRSGRHVAESTRSRLAVLNILITRGRQNDRVIGSRVMKAARR